MEDIDQYPDVRIFEDCRALDEAEEAEMIFARP